MMVPVLMVGEVLEGIQNAKAGVADFLTNFFPAQARVQAWIDHGELLRELRQGVTFFLRKDRDFWRLYFCAATPGALQREAGALADLKERRVLTDLVGTEPLPGGALAALQAVGFRPYTRLRRMARLGPPDEQQSAPGHAQVCTAEASDCRAILGLLESEFDVYGEQLPLLYEVESAVQAGQILVVKRDESIAGLLFFETRGLASAIRFWVVLDKFRGLRVGSALMSRYFEIQSLVRRFTLWVDAGNDDAITKYRHYGYAPDGLIDHVLENQLIQS